MAPTVYLITGANRGLGFGFVQAILERPDVVVFAGARDPSRADKLKALAAEHPNKIHVVKITSADETDNKAAVEEIKRIAGRLDIVISNAAFSDMSGPVIATPTKMMTDAFAVNALGTLVLFQATYPLLKASTSTPKFIPISSALGSITMGTQYPAPFLAYGTSKAALNYTARKIRADTEGLVAFPICPGIVETEGLVHNRDELGLPFPPGTVFKTPLETAKHILTRIDEGNRETDAFIQFDGKVLPW